MDYSESLLSAIRATNRQETDPYQSLISTIVSAAPSLYGRYYDVIDNIDLVASAQLNPQLTAQYPPSIPTESAGWALYLACRAYCDSRVHLTSASIRAHANAQKIKTDEIIIRWILTNSIPRATSASSLKSKCLLWDALCRLADENSVIRRLVERHKKDDSAIVFESSERRGFQPTEDLDEVLQSIISSSPVEPNSLYRSTYHLIQSYSWL